MEEGGDDAHWAPDGVWLAQVRTAIAGGESVTWHATPAGAAHCAWLARFDEDPTLRVSAAQELVGAIRASAMDGAVTAGQRRTVLDCSWQIACDAAARDATDSATTADKLTAAEAGAGAAAVRLDDPANHISSELAAAGCRALVELAQVEWLDDATADSMWSQVARFKDGGDGDRLAAATAADAICFVLEQALDLGEQAGNVARQCLASTERLKALGELGLTALHASGSPDSQAAMKFLASALRCAPKVAWPPPESTDGDSAGHFEPLAALATEVARSRRDHYLCPEDRTAPDTWRRCGYEVDEALLSFLDDAVLMPDASTVLGERAEEFTSAMVSVMQSSLGAGVERSRPQRTRAIAAECLSDLVREEAPCLGLEKLEPLLPKLLARLMENAEFSEADATHSVRSNSGATTVRRVSASAIDAIFECYGERAISVLLPPVSACLHPEYTAAAESASSLSSSDDVTALHKERATLVVGIMMTVAQSSYAAVEPLLPAIIKLAAPGAWMPNRETACWTLGESWPSLVRDFHCGEPELLDAALSAVIECTCSPDGASGGDGGDDAGRSRTDALRASALSSLTMLAEAGGADFFEANPDGARRMLIAAVQSLGLGANGEANAHAWDVIASTAEVIGDALAQPSYASVIIPAVIEAWKSASPDKVAAVGLLAECTASVIIAMQGAWAAHAPAVLSKCVLLVHACLDALIAGEGSAHNDTGTGGASGAAGGPSDDEGSENGDGGASETVGALLDVLGQTADAIGDQEFVSALEGTERGAADIVELLVSILKAGSVGGVLVTAGYEAMRSSAFALAGSLARAGTSLLLATPGAVECLLQALRATICDDCGDAYGPMHRVDLQNNALWCLGVLVSALGEVGSLSLSVIAEYVPHVIRPLAVRELAGNAAITLGRMAKVLPDEYLMGIAPEVIPPLLVVATGIREREEQLFAVLGAMKLVVRNVAAAAPSTLHIVQLLGSLDEGTLDAGGEVAEVTASEANVALSLLRQHMGAADWRAHVLDRVSAETFPFLVNRFAMSVE